ncbi:glutamate--cysteine ligase [Candidatus Methylospira mobilis]|uniref:glutamate--cysteine ligase n=1 Tax=Candidatus Methylospira mobilis TaxID=1808979 RepID=UPI001D174BCE|nr:glutamate--cysteine ligase [Candidatus Methylospira mobilis]WNV02936.1 glutamate--cysteine ligase [Candidatus Methylospira mobilis]
MSKLFLNISIEPRLKLLTGGGAAELLKGGLKGLEKESLRVTPEGGIAQTPHPEALGSALTHPYITTDYSEALLELVTPAYADAGDTLAFLHDLHRFVYAQIGDEALWSNSMPCPIRDERSIPIAQYGTSNVGTMKHVYRRGLDWRYGRAMQAIAGIHYNYSINQALWPVWQELLGNGCAPEQFISDQYFGMIRNVKRYAWIVMYLMGASPAFSSSFFSGRDELSRRFERLDADTLYRPHATTLRMSDIGYRNDSQVDLGICFNSLDGYVASLARAIDTASPVFEKIGVKVDGEYRQLNANILQISNEYYSPVRPKQIAFAGERPTMALYNRGVRYIELRAIDLGWQRPSGISLEDMRFLEVFLLFCFLQESPPITADEDSEIARNTLAVACCGRGPEFTLQWHGRHIAITEFVRALQEPMQAITAILDQGESMPLYRKSLAHAFVENPESTPSARMLADMRSRGESFAEYHLRQSLEHAAVFRTEPLVGTHAIDFESEATLSHAEQARMEAEDTMSFDDYLQHYFSQDRVQTQPARRKQLLSTARYPCSPE